MAKRAKKKMPCGRMNQTEYYKVLQSIRTLFSRSDWYKECVSTRLSKETGSRGGKRYDCDHCNKAFSISDMNLHHDPQVVAEDEHYSQIPIDEFITRVYADKDKMFYLCKDCHTKEHNKEK